MNRRSRVVFDSSDLGGILPDLPGSEEIESVTRVARGFTTGEKFVVTTRAGCFFVRVGSLARQGTLVDESAMLKICRGNRIPCPEPVAVGVDPDRDLCYSILTFIEGQTADQVLPDLSDREVAELGLASGQLLRRIHEIVPSGDSLNVRHHHRDRYEHWSEKLHGVGVVFHGQRQVERYIDQQLNSMQEVAARFQHSDYHPGHLIVHDGELAGVIDFDRSEWNDPFRDFQRLPWNTCPTSLVFARAQIAGYFPAGIPTNFWPRYNLYIALTLHRGAWAAHVKWPHNEDLFMRRTVEIVDAHDFQDGGPPTWFHDDVDLIKEVPTS